MIWHIMIYTISVIGRGLLLTKSNTATFRYFAAPQTIMRAKFLSSFDFIHEHTPHHSSYSTNIPAMASDDELSDAPSVLSTPFTTAKSTASSAPPARRTRNILTRRPIANIASKSTQQATQPMKSRSELMMRRLLGK